MPGVRELLDTLAARDDVYLALLTGNYEAGARLKLEYFDLWRYFPCGAFGDGAADRNGLVPKAMARVAGCGGPAVATADVVVIGDTPLDVACAAAAGAHSIAVATGSHTARIFVRPVRTWCFEDLGDTRRVLAALASFEVSSVRPGDPTDQREASEQGCSAGSASSALIVVVRRNLSES